MKNSKNKYIKYYQDNPKNYWFKRKIFGWGWTPVKWQGWVFLLAWVLTLIKVFILVDANSHSVSDTLQGMLAPFILLVIILILVCYGTGEKPKWSWGLKNN